ncbi:rRNA biogenesis protein RRP36 [Babesia duncani]|uniref:rRNA biogenesis protein RRP36 n=1 Tax=Babesia duncani TaxID=323732 RepID=A0AAD9PK41_9APIC|nr:rRNA biogenesis protein RRP36 [Babesia duncani]
MTELTLGELKRQRELEQSQNTTNDSQDEANVKTRVFKNVNVKKRKSKAPVELPSNAPFNPFEAKLKKGNKTRYVPRDPRFSEYSGPLDMEQYKKSYSFLNDMRREEAKEIRAAIKIANSSKSTQATNAALSKLSHLGITDLESAKRILNRLETQEMHLGKVEEIKQLKKSLVDAEKEKIMTTNKKPFYYSDKKVKQIYKQKRLEKINSAVTSSAINYGDAKAIHKQIEKRSKRKLQKERKRMPEILFNKE